MTDNFSDDAIEEFLEVLSRDSGPTDEEKARLVAIVRELLRQRLIYRSRSEELERRMANWREIPCGF